MLSADEEQGPQTGGRAGKGAAAAETDDGETPGGGERTEDTIVDAELNPLEEEVVLEEVILDDEEPAAEEAPSSAEKPEEERGEAEALNGPVGEGDEGDRDENSGKHLGRVFLHRKKTFVWAGTLLFVMGFSFLFFFEGSRTKDFGLRHLFSSMDGKGQSFAKTVLKPFFVPLAGNAEHAALCLIVSVMWDPQTLARYREKQAQVRNEVYQFLLHAAESSEDMVKEKRALESKLSAVFQHALAARHITVNVDEASTI